MGKKLKDNTKNRFMIEQLETRLLLSSDLVFIPFDGSLPPQDAADSPSVVESGPLSGTVELFDVAGQERLRHEIVFVDAGVKDYQKLVDDLRARGDDGRRIEVLVLDGNRDGIEQISETLAWYKNLDAVHVVSHGTDGALQLGNTMLQLASLDHYAGSIEGWRNALGSEADLLFYGCDLAAGEEGRALIESLTYLTGADVAASEDATGTASLGGDWVLEYRAGEIETPIAFSVHTQQTWSGQLAVITVTTFNDVVNAGDGLISLREAIIAANATDASDIINLSAGTYTLSIREDILNPDTTATGDLDILKDLTILGTGAGSTLIDATGLPGDRIFEINGAAVTIDGVTFQKAQKGAILTNKITYSLTLSNTEFLNNSGNNGGAILNNGTLNISSSVFSNNAANNGGAISNNFNLTVNDVVFSDNTANNAGGAIQNNSTAIFTDVKLVRNTATHGGGIYNLDGSANLSLTNVSITDNTATIQGGGIYSNKPIDATNVTIAYNKTTAGGGAGGGVYLQGTGAVNLKNSIISNNLSDGGANSTNTLTSLGNNITDDGTTLSNPPDIINTDPKLEPALSGALLHPLLPESPIAGLNIGAFPNSSLSATNLSATEIYTEDTPLGLTDIVVSDVDSANVTVTLTLSDIAAGSLSTGTSGAVTSTFVDGVWTASGAIVDVNTLLAGVTFTPALNYSSNFTIATIVSDGGAAPITRVKNMIGIAVNDAPTGISLDNMNVDEDAAPTVIDLSAVFDDVDIVTTGDTLSLSVISSNPALVSASLSGNTLTLTYGAEQNGTAVITVRATDTGGLFAETTFSVKINPVGDTPQVANMTTLGGILSDFIVINRNSNDGTEVTHFRISNITNGTLYLADGVTQINNGAYITLEQAQAGLRFMPSSNSVDNGSFAVESSENGHSVAAQSGVAISLITVIIPAPTAPEDGMSGQETNPGSADQNIPEVVLEVPGNLSVINIPVHTNAPAPMPRIDTGKVTQNSDHKALTTDNFLKDSQKTGDQNHLPSVRNYFGNLENLGIHFVENVLKTLLPGQGQSVAFERTVAKAYEHLRDSLDSLKKETAKDIMFGKATVGSAIVVSASLSAGYVVWLIRGGMLLSSVLSSLPAWQFVDPLPVLAQRRDDSDSEDEESLESIAKSGSQDDDRNETKHDVS